MIKNILERGTSCGRDGDNRLTGGAIRLIYPTKEQRVCLANDDVEKWLTPYSPNHLGENYGKGDHFAGQEVEFRWEYDGNADYFVLEVAESEDYENCLRYRSAEKRVMVGDLNVFAEYSWRVTAYKDNKEVAKEESCFKTAKSPRAISLDGVSNARDIAFFSKTLKKGMIFRTAVLDGITEKGLTDALLKYGIKTDIDLRNSGEGSAGQGSPLGKGVNYFSLPGSYYVATGASIKDPLYQQNMAQAIQVFADENNYPILFHCAIGRDRTGTLAAVLEAFLGADRDDITTDYEMSFFSDAGCKDGSTPDVMIARIMEIYDFLSEYGEGTLQENTTKFLRDIGVNPEKLENIKKIMTKPENV